MYTKQEIIEKISKPKIGDKYKAPCVNYTGRDECGDYYTETISKHLVEKVDFAEIKTVSRLKGYKIASHFNGCEKRIPIYNKTNRLEEIEAKELINSKLEIKNGDMNLGRLIDYQIPLKNVKTDYGLGKIDLISESAESIFLIELKNSKSTETLLRCILEIETYYHTIDEQLLLKSYGVVGKTVRKAILIFKDTIPYNEYIDIENRPYLRKLLDELAIDIFIVLKVTSYENE